jgi:uncharacterized membrane protein YedE/YeeE
MVQIMLNYLYIFIIPIIIGFAVRFFTRKIKRAYWVTVFFLVLSFVAWIIVYVVPSKGSEMHGIWALQATAAAIGSLVTGIAIWLKNSGSR